MGKRPSWGTGDFPITLDEEKEHLWRCTVAHPYVYSPLWPSVGEEPVPRTEAVRENNFSHWELPGQTMRGATRWDAPRSLVCPRVQDTMGLWKFKHG